MVESFSKLVSKPKTLAQSILWTVAYTDQFQYPLTEIEIWERLLRTEQRTGKGFGQSQKLRQNFQKELKNLVRSKKLSSQKGLQGHPHSDSFFFLSRHSKNVALRQKRNVASAQKWRQVTNFVRLVSWIPWIRSIWVTGSLAMMNAQQNQDVDFMLVTQANRLWLTRAIVTGVAFLAGKKRKPHGREDQTWCLNLWIDEKHLAVPNQKRSPYAAYEVAQAKVVFERGASAQKFWRANQWVVNFLENWSAKLNGKRVAVESNSSANITDSANSTDSASSPLGKLFNWMEKICFRVQLQYMQQHRTTEQVDAGFAFFHPRHTEQLVSQEWQRRRKKLQ